jgi:hypothetical protein
MKRTLLYVTTMLAILFTAAGASAELLVTSGANFDVDFNPEVPVPYSGFAGQYFLTVDLIHDPQAGPMIKRFQSPITDTLDTILLHANLPNPQRITENFNIVPSLAGDPTLATAVSDWHEEFLTRGFEWVLPGDTRFPNLFANGTSLITRNGQPHPWQFQPGPAVHDPSKLWVEFPPINPGETLDIHKALLWVGTSDNSVWGDNATDNGVFNDESRINVWEYPTPEPTTAALVALGCLGLLRRRR